MFSIYLIHPYISLSSIPLAIIISFHFLSFLPGFTFPLYPLFSSFVHPPSGSAYSRINLSLSLSHTRSSGILRLCLSCTQASWTPGNSSIDSIHPLDTDMAGQERYRRTQYHNFEGQIRQARGKRCLVSFKHAFDSLDPGIHEYHSTNPRLPDALPPPSVRLVRFQVIDRLYLVNDIYIYNVFH